MGRFLLVLSLISLPCTLHADESIDVSIYLERPLNVIRLPQVYSATALMKNRPNEIRGETVLIIRKSRYFLRNCAQDI